MGKIIIMQEKADSMVEKLQDMKECVEEMIDCFAECMEGNRHYPEPEDEEEWDDEYEIKRRRGSRGIYPKGYRRGMRKGMRTDTSRY